MSKLYFIVKNGKVMRKAMFKDEIVMVGEKVMDIDAKRHPDVKAEFLIVQDGALHDTRSNQLKLEHG